MFARHSKQFFDFIALRVFNTRVSGIILKKIFIFEFEQLSMIFMKFTEICFFEISIFMLKLTFLFTSPF